ncbi:MAG: condensation domain-containing protein [Caldilineaceae bacterium]
MASQATQQGAAPLLPIQRWFFAANQPALHHFNQSFLLTVKQAVDLTLLARAIHALLQHHDALRFRYGKCAGEREGEGAADNELCWQQEYLAAYMGDENHIPLTVVDLRDFAPQAQSAEIERIGTATQADLDPLTGDLVRFVYFQMGESCKTPDRLLIVIHHLAVDGVSWRILLEDLTTLLDGKALPLKTSSYRDWGEALQSATAAGHFDQEMKRWLAEEQGRYLMPLPLDKPDATNTIGSSHQLTLTLSVEETEQLLQTLPEQHDMTLDAVVLTALTETLVGSQTSSANQTNLRVRFESHGRQELFETISLNRTVGWFTSTYPLSIARFAGSAVQRIRYTLEQLRRVTDGGISFGALQHFHPDETVRAKMAALPEAEMVYNYLGQLDSLDNHRFGMAPEAAGPAVSPAMMRDTLLDSNALILNGQLHIHWTVTPQIDHQQAQALLDKFQQQLHGLMQEALTSHEQVAIPTDFEDTDISLEHLASLLNDTKQTQPELFFSNEDEEI